MKLDTVNSVCFLFLFCHSFMQQVNGMLWYHLSIKQNTKVIPNQSKNEREKTKRQINKMPLPNLRLYASCMSISSPSDSMTLIFFADSGCHSHRNFGVSELLLRHWKPIQSIFGIKSQEYSLLGSTKYRTTQRNAAAVLSRFTAALTLKFLCEMWVRAEFELAIIRSPVYIRWLAILCLVLLSPPRIPISVFFPLRGTHGELLK